MKNLRDWDDDILVVLNDKLGYIITYDANDIFLDVIEDLEQERKFYKYFISEVNFLKGK